MNEPQTTRDFEALRLTDPDAFEAECRRVCEFARQRGWFKERSPGDDTDNKKRATVRVAR